MPSSNNNLLKDFIREIDIMKRLDHPNIVKIINFVQEPEVAIIMEFIKYRSFLTYLKCYNKPNLTTQLLLKYAKDIASVSLFVYFC